MSIRKEVFAILPFLVVGIVGCQEPQRRAPSVAVEEGTTTIEGLARNLRLQIEERDETFVVLKDAANTVIIFTHTDGRFFVNGRPVGSVGTVERAGSTVTLSDTLASQIRPHLRKATPEAPVVRPRRPRVRGLVVVDAGHGGRDPGTTSARGTYEKNINLRVAAKIARRLEAKGIGVVMTRWQDKYLELEERAAVANDRNADLFVSIHADSEPSKSIQGFTIYVATGASWSARQAAQAISETMSRTGADTRGIREADYRVLVQTRCPAVLIELGYLSNAWEAARLRDGNYQDRLADAIVEGILNYLR
jgi:N-acetylmuramoyl-L-alanine amidase